MIDDLRHNMDFFQEHICTWSRRTFGPGQTEEAVVNKLKEEFAEFSCKPTPSEAADIAILLLQFCRQRNAFLSDEIIKKMDINKARKWHPPDPQTGTIRHRDPQPQHRDPGPPAGPDERRRHGEEIPDSGADG